MKRDLGARLIAALLMTCALTDSPALAEPGGKPDVSAPSQPAWPADAVTRHQVTVKGRAIGYQATAGTLALTAPDGAPRGRMFYVAYVADRAKGEPPRPITFVYNGGPGSSSIWMHMGSFGPVRVVTPFPEAGRPGRYQLAPNADTLLDTTDLVFLDAMSTGFSRGADSAATRSFMGIDQDAAGFAQAIRLYLDADDRWMSPKFLMGESYGATRSALLAYRLQAENIDLAGVTLISSILNFGDQAPGLDRGTVNLLPTFAAIARYHGKATKSGELQAFWNEVKTYAEGPYAVALAKGHNIGAAERDAVAERVAGYTGLSVDYLKRVNLRIETSRFRRELLRDQGRIVGELDGRAVAYDADRGGERAEFDPAESIQPAFVAAFHDYLTGELKYRAAMPYNALDDSMMEVWDWSHQPPAGHRQISMADVALDLGAAMRRNPHLKVLSLNGYYDLVTPYFATEFDLAHMNLEPALVGNITFKAYESGHMIYLSQAALSQMKADIAAFYADALK